MSANALYCDLSKYYDLMCADIDYQAQSHCVHRLQQIFGNGGKTHLDLACGTAPHIYHFIKLGYQTSGLDLNQPMLDIAAQRCPNARFYQQNMCNFTIEDPVDLITCFLYSIHYSNSIENLLQCAIHAHQALKPQGVFCFNLVDKNKIDNRLFVEHSVKQDDALFTFHSSWYYKGTGENQALKLSIEKTNGEKTQKWQDEHSMVALSINQLIDILSPYFELHIFEHDYDKIIPWDNQSGNAIIVAVKK